MLLVIRAKDQPRGRTADGPSVSSHDGQNNQPDDEVDTPMRRSDALYCAGYVQPFGLISTFEFI